MKQRWIYFGLLILLLADFGYSFQQYYSTPLDGDLAGGIVPAEDVKQVLASPFGFDVFKNKEGYSNPNRFFCHWPFYKYFNTVPFFLQRFVSPIDSLYLSCAIVKLLMQIALTLLLAMAISGTINMLKFDFLLSAVLITPLFQTNGYRAYMGIIDSATTYTFFYALPCILVLIYFLPFIFQFYHNKRIFGNIFIALFFIPLAIVISLSGPLNPGIVLVFSLLVISGAFIHHYNLSNSKTFFKKGIDALLSIPKKYWFYLVPISVFSLYSLYLGLSNSITIFNKIPLSESYLKLPEGIYYQFFQQLGFPVLFLILAINCFLINRYFKNEEGKKILSIFKWIGLFSLIYILLLPLGGYRSYRPYILRYDTILPITLSLLFVFGITTLFILKHITLKSKKWYIVLISIVLLIFTNADNAKFDKNKNERIALNLISKSKETIVPLPIDYTVLSWVNISKPEDSELNAKLLMLLNITKVKKQYYNK